eukprot:Gb_09687 [translate_table: standard]
MALVPGTAHVFVTTSPSLVREPSVATQSLVSVGLRLLPHFKQSLSRPWSWSGGVLKESRVGARSVCVACLPSSPPESPTTKLFVSGLSFSTTEESLKNAFLRFGELVEVKIIMDKFAKRSKGFGFIQYATEAEAQEAIKGMDGKFLDGRVIFVEVARPKPQFDGPPPRATGPPRLF